MTNNPMSFICIKPTRVYQRWIGSYKGQKVEDPPAYLDSCQSASLRVDLKGWNESLLFSVLYYRGYFVPRCEHTYHYSVVPKDMSADPKNFNCRRTEEVVVIVRSLSKGNESCSAFHLRLYLRLYGFCLRRRCLSSRNP